jgi:hypothetical protein
MLIVVQGEFRVDAAGAPALHNSLLYKLCYHRFGQMTTDSGKPTGYDRVRAAEIGVKVRARPRMRVAWVFALRVPVCACARARSSLCVLVCAYACVCVCV